MDNEDLGRYQNMLPSRAVLARLALFGTDAETRDSANAILRALPPMSADERRRYYDEMWLWSLPSDLEKSPAGLATLELLKNSKPVPREIQKPAGNVAQVEPGPPAEPEASPQEPLDDGVNEHLRRIAWPPKSSPLPPPPEIAEVPDWIRHLDRPQIIPWIDDSNNAPLE